MSNIVTNACRPLRLPPSQKAVLMALADRADDAGVAWPSIPWICEWTCLGRTTVIDALKALEARGLIVIVKCQGRNNQCSVDLGAVANYTANPSGSRTGTGTAAGRVDLGNEGADQSGNRTGGSPEAPGQEAQDPSDSRTGPAAAPVRQPDPHPSGSRTGVVRQPDGGSPAAVPDTSINTHTPDKTSKGASASEPGHEAKPFALEPVERTPARKPAKKARRDGFDAMSVELPQWLERETWELWVRDRSKRGQAITEDAARLQLRSLDKLRREGHAPTEVIENAVAMGWRGLWAPSHKAGAGTTQSVSDGRGRRRGVHNGLDQIDHNEGISEDGYIL